MDWAKLLEAIFSQCGLVSALLGAGLVYQTWQRGKDREACDRDRQKAAEDAEARTEALMALARAQERLQGFLMARGQILGVD
jgi:hypothetical protein